MNNINAVLILYWTFGILSSFGIVLSCCTYSQIGWKIRIDIRITIIIWSTKRRNFEVATQHGDIWAIYTEENKPRINGLV